MNDMTFKVYFNMTNFEGTIYSLIPGLKEAMQSELIRVYNIYADKTNAGVTDKLNKRFYDLYPNYFKDNKGKDWYEMALYNKFMAAGYQQLVVNELNRSNVSPILDFYVDPEEVVFTGRLKADHKVTINFYMKKVE